MAEDTPAGGAVNAIPIIGRDDDSIVPRTGSTATMAHAGALRSDLDGWLGRFPGAPTGTVPPLAPRLLAAGVRRFRVELVWETQAQTADVLTAWQSLLAGDLTPAQVLRRTGVHEQFGVSAGTMRILGQPAP